MYYLLLSFAVRVHGLLLFDITSTQLLSSSVGILPFPLSHLPTSSPLLTPFSFHFTFLFTSLTSLFLPIFPHLLSLPPCLPSPPHTFTLLHFIYLDSRLIFSLTPLIHSLTTYSTTILLLPPLSILPAFHRFLLRLNPQRLSQSSTGFSTDPVAQLARDGKPFARLWAPVSP